MLVPITAQEVTKAMDTLKRRKAMGNSWITPELLRRQEQEGLAASIACLFNQVVHMGPPMNWNQLTITSIPKAGDKLDPGNYRGIAIMSTMPKLYA